jgi:magnesium transporter
MASFRSQTLIPEDILWLLGFSHGILVGMISKYTYKKLTWIDLEAPTREEVRSVLEEYRLPELLEEDLMSPSPRAKVERYENAISLVLHFPVLGRKNREHIEEEIDCIIGKNFVITAHEEPVNALNEFSNLFEIRSALDQGVIGEHAGHLFYFMIREMYHHVLVELESVNTAIHDIERRLFNGDEHQLVSAISKQNRILVDFRQTMRFHREALASFERAANDFFGSEFSYYLGAITGEYNKIEQTLNGEREILSDLRNTNDSLLASKTNDVMRKLTIMNFIMLPLGLITWIFAMRSDLVYIRGTGDFLLVLGAMALIALAMYVYFKNKKWL